MRHRLFRLMALLLALLLLVGCGKDQKANKNGTAPATAAPTTAEPTTVPTEPTEPPVMDAESIFWKLRYAVMGERANQYTLTEKINLRYGAEGVYFRIEATVASSVMLSVDPYAINLQNRIFTSMMGVEIEQNVHYYYRIEDEEPVLYVYMEHLDYGERVELGDLGMTNYEFLQSFNTVFIPGSVPNDLTVDEEKHVIADREAYALRYTDTAQNVFQMTTDQEISAMLAQIEVPVVWYVDAETFKPLQRDMLLHEVGDELGKIIKEIYGSALGEDLAGTTMEISEYSQTVTEIIFDTVEVPDVPEEVIEKTKESGGYSEV